MSRSNARLWAVGWILVLAVPVSAAPIQYAVTDLGTLGGWGNSSMACGINARGQVAGYSDIGGANNAFLYDGGTMTDIGTLGGIRSQASAINSGGQVVGWADIYPTSQTVYHAFLYIGGTMADLGTLGGTNSAAWGINASGEVVGQATTHGNTSTHAFLYSGGTMSDLGTLGGTASAACGINASGQVIGNSSISGNAAWYAFLYSGGTMVSLGTLGGAYSYASAINDSGQVVGVAETGTGEQHAFLYSGGTMADLGTGGMYGSSATAINTSGQVVGATWTGTGDSHAFLYCDGILTDVNSLIDPTSGWTLESATGINDNGQITGFGVNSSGQDHAFLLSPVPEPATLTLLALGGLACWRRRVRATGKAVALVLVAGLVLAGHTARADVFNMGGTRNADGSWTGVANLETVPVGNPGNAADTAAHSGNSAGQGAVGYTYNIGKYEVTAGQYTAFLNAVAATDTYGLYNTYMDSHSYGCQITRHGTSGSYTYDFSGRPNGAESDWVNRPVNFVSWGDAARFANWLTNGQPTGAQGDSTTEDGSYDLNGAITDVTLMAVVVPNATQRALWASGSKKYYLIPSEDEWYKAAYYNGGSGVYYDYPTGTNSVPSNALIDPDPGNNANFWGSNYTIGSPYYRTPVGEFENSESPYGTFDQGGNVWEWNEAVILSHRGLRGGAGYNYEFYGLLASLRYDIYPTREFYSLGFRVSQVPEPGTIALLALGSVGVLLRRGAVRR